ncbi:MAG: hypothetical protein BIFFINMI_01330 [Phycisphaerae bacterium]|nr:hypothetical protein [Phycisphaerae bacterium]
MNASASSQYLRTKVMTASPEQLQMMLYDGALRFTRQGHAALLAGRNDVACEAILRAQQIILELSSSMKSDADPELVGRLNSLYHYIHRRMVEANVHHDAGALAEAIELIEYQRETWRLLMESLARDSGLRLHDPAGREDGAARAKVDVAC